MKRIEDCHNFEKETHSHTREWEMCTTPRALAKVPRPQGVLYCYVVTARLCVCAYQHSHPTHVDASDLMATEHKTCALH